MRAELLDLHQRLRTTTIYVTHDQMEAMTMGDRIVVMQHGKIQQVASPQELYDHPVNKYVAGFIGSPAMNFLPCAVVEKSGDCFLKGDGFFLKLPEKKVDKAKKYVDKEVIMGIRPDYIALNTEPSQFDDTKMVKGSVWVIEPMGSECIVHFKVGEKIVVSRIITRINRINLRPNDHAEFLLNMNRVHLFDKDSEVTIV